MKATIPRPPGRGHVSSIAFVTVECAPARSRELPPTYLRDSPTPRLVETKKKETT